jgi:hypothetical protein
VRYDDETRAGLTAALELLAAPTAPEAQRPRMTTERHGGTVTRRWG